MFAMLIGYPVPVATACVTATLSPTHHGNTWPKQIEDCATNTDLPCRHPFLLHPPPSTFLQQGFLVVRAESGRYPVTRTDRHHRSGGAGVRTERPCIPGEPGGEASTYASFDG